MKDLILLIQLLFFAIGMGHAQSRFFLEAKINTLKTWNDGHLEGGGGGLSGYMITKEGNPMTIGYSIGLGYTLNQRNSVKLHFGRHRNGRILDLMVYDDLLNKESYSGLNKPYDYFQIAPSYTFRILNLRFALPVEVGLAINCHQHPGDIFFVSVKKINYDFIARIGFDYRVLESLMIGVYGIYSKSINEYQNQHYVIGTFKPRQTGFELSLLKELK